MADVLGQLEATVAGRGLPALARNLGALAELVGPDLAWCEESLRRIEELRAPTAVARSARHLIELGGKRPRPLCVALAARAGDGFGAAPRPPPPAAPPASTPPRPPTRAWSTRPPPAGSLPRRAWSTATRRRSSPATGCWWRRSGASAPPPCPTRSTVCSTSSRR